MKKLLWQNLIRKYIQFFQCGMFELISDIEFAIKNNQRKIDLLTKKNPY